MVCVLQTTFQNHKIHEISVLFFQVAIFNTFFLEKRLNFNTYYDFFDAFAQCGLIIL